MGKEGGGMTPKAISNKIKAKGLQRLRWYCQFCQKQCRDENGFKCHISSTSHINQMEIVASNSGMFVDQYSKEFEDDFIKILSRRYPTTRVAANQVYNEFIQDRNHIHMNATRWPSLSEFVKYLGRESKCVVEETAKGWYITYINRDPTFVRNQSIAAATRERVEMTDEERQRIDIEKRLREMSKVSTLKEENTHKPTEISTDQLQSISLSFKPINQNNTNNPTNPTPSTSITSSTSPSSSTTTSTTTNIFNAFSMKNNNNNTQNQTVHSQQQKKSSALDEIMEKQEQLKKIQLQKQQQLQQQQKQTEQSSSSNEEKGWLIENLIVKIIDKELKEYYKWKGVVEKVSDDGYIGKIRLLDDENVTLNIDQEFLETVIPGQGQQVMVVDGRYRGRLCKLLDIDIDKFSANLIDLETDQTLNNIPYEHFCKIK